MAAPFSPPNRSLCDAGDRVDYVGRPASVIEVRSEGYTLLFDEWIDPETGVVHEKHAATIEHADMNRANMFGRLIVTRANRGPLRPGGVEPIYRTPEEVELKNFRKVHMDVIGEWLEDGRLEKTRESFIEHAAAIADEVLVRLIKVRRSRSGRGNSRSGAKTGVTIEDKKELRGGRTLFDHWRLYVLMGEGALFANYRNCGRASPYSTEEREIVREVVEQRLNEERPTIQSIVDSVAARIHHENKVRAAKKTPLPPLKTPGYDFVHGMIDAIAPIEHKIRTRGLKVAYADMHSVGQGFETHRLLQAVFVDEYEMDLMVLLKKTGIFEHLTDWEKEQLGLDGTPKRVVLAAGIDHLSRKLCGFKISPEGKPRPLSEVVEMIYLDKDDITDAAGCIYRWGPGGAPEGVHVDRGANYVSLEAYFILEALGITNFGGPAGKPWLRAFIERLFQTIHKTFVTRFSGRTFSDVVAKGENDAEGRATLTLDGLLQWLTRWIVDIYHNERHSALGMTPRQKWDMEAATAPVRSATNRELNLAFGCRDQRKVTPSGIVCMGIVYQTKKLQSLFRGSKDGRRSLPEKVEISFWERDIGAIQVKVGPEEWLTVTALDERWFGKDLAYYRAVRAKLVQVDPEADDACLSTIFEMDQESLRKQSLAKLVTPRMTQDSFQYLDEKYSRHMKSADQNFDEPEFEDLFDDEVEGPDAPETERSPDEEALRDEPATPTRSPRSATSKPKAPQSFDDDDLME